MTGWTKDDFERFLRLCYVAESNHQLLTELTAQQRKTMALLDSEVTLLNTIDTNVLNVISEIQALKATNPTVDTTAIDAAIAKLQSDVATVVTDAAPAATTGTGTATS